MGILLCTFVILLLGGESKWFQMFLNRRACNMECLKVFKTYTPALLWSSLRKWKQSGARREMSGITRPEESVVLRIVMVSQQ